MSGIRELFDLQEIDRQIDARQARVAQIAREVEGNSNLIQARAALAARRSELAKAEAHARAGEEEAAANRARISLLEQRMYSGLVTSPRELQSMTTEVKNLIERQAGLDASVRERRDLAIPLAKAVDDRMTMVAALEQQWASQTEKLVAERARLEQESAAWQERRQRHASMVPVASLSLYTRLKASKANVAVVKVERGICGGCRMTIPTVLVQKARAGREFVYCSSCARLLYVV
jgi:predicted  nucleic acid-binding Zn-ribbon protein